MTGYVNWHALTQPIKGDLVQLDGNIVADGEVLASTETTAVAPEGAQYASVWCTVASTVEANLISPKKNPAGETIYNAKEYAVPPETFVTIPNVIAGKTTITVTDIS